MDPDGPPRVAMSRPRDQNDARPRQPAPRHPPTDRGAGRRLRHLPERIVPSRWTLLLATISVACLLVLTVTGVLLLFWYDPSNETVIYDGSYRPLRGVEMSKALDSTLHISFEVRGGLLVRQAHHWAALILPASLMLHMLSIFFTGGFRRPRHWNWVLLSLVFVLALAGGWSGYALPDDSLSGTGLRVVEGITLSIPVIGTSLTGLLFGGEFPGQVLTRLYWLHVLVVPMTLIAVLALRLRAAGKPGLARVAGVGRDQGTGVRSASTVVVVRAIGLVFVAGGVLVGMAGTLTIAPVWLYGPASSSDASAGSQPDWYTSFLDGALRLVPPGWEVSWLGGTWALGVLVPQAVVGVFLLIVVMYPFLEAGLARDRAVHHVLDRPRDAPNRTAIGVAGLVFYGTLWAAAGTDLIATQFHVAFETQVYLLRCILLVGPIVAYWLTRRICLGLQARDRGGIGHGLETGIVRRRPDGGYGEVHAPHGMVDTYRSSVQGVTRPSPSRGGTPTA